MDALLSEANRLLLDGQPKSARQLFAQAIEEHDLAIPPVLHNAALCLEVQQQYEEAIAEYETIERDFPGYIRSTISRANCLRHLHQHAANLEALRSAAAADPHWPQTQFLLSAALLRLNRVDEACKAALGGFTNAAMFMARDTNHYVQAYYDPMSDSTYTCRKGSATLLDFLYSEKVPEATIFSLHQAVGESLQQAAPAKLHCRRVPPGSLPRIGYVSEYFFDSSVMAVWLPLSQHHTSRVRVTCYYLGKRKDAVTEQLEATYGADFKQMNSPEAAVHAMQRDGLDILVCLDGHTGSQLALQAAAARVAPVQIDYAGYPATTGVPEIDYKLVDGVTDPPGEHLFYSERLLRMPECFLCWQPPAPRPTGPKPTPARAGGCRLLSANNWKKCSPQFLQLADEILACLPHATLHFKTSLHDQAELLFDTFIKHNFSAGAADRVHFLPYEDDKTEHLCVTHGFDLALDPVAYNGTITTLECLWCSVPVVALRGTTHRTRVSASLLQAAGLEELVAETRVDYVRKAVSLAINRERLAKYHDTVADKLQQSPLMDYARFAQQYEDLLLGCWSSANTCKTIFYRG